MMTQTFIATIAFSIGLLAFCAGAWLTIWATSSSQIADVAAAKLTGYFVTILALVALVFTSYFIATGILGSNQTTSTKPTFSKHVKNTKAPKNAPHRNNMNPNNVR